ncbi:MAG: DUF4248 domain-containing protein [Mediterranea massiliensis]|nr:DUF4248 domain-containing protein [Mediterranea massiliensis]
MKYLKFSELAQAYFPGCSKAANAVRCFSREIKRCSSLFEKLKATGYKPYSHRVLSPKQVEIIYSELGNPFETI